MPRRRGITSCKAMDSTDWSVLRILTILILQVNPLAMPGDLLYFSKDDKYREFRVKITGKVTVCVFEELIQ